jgi:hypothetical protein
VHLEFLGRKKAAISCVNNEFLAIF